MGPAGPREPASRRHRAHAHARTHARKHTRVGGGGWGKVYIAEGFGVRVGANSCLQKGTVSPLLVGLELKACQDGSLGCTDGSGIGVVVACERPCGILLGFSISTDGLGCRAWV